MNTIRTDKVKITTATPVEYCSLERAAERVGMQPRKLAEMVMAGEFKPAMTWPAPLFTDDDIARLRPIARKERKKESALEPKQKNYTPKQLATEWGVSVDTIRRKYESDPRCIHLGNRNPKKGRRYGILRIPLWVAEEDANANRRKP